MLSAALLAGLAACGDDGGSSTLPDGCVGHLCGSGSGAALTDPEGGNIIFEYIYLDTELQQAFQLPNGVTTIQRTMAYFMDAQTPEDNPLPMPGQCNNLETTHGWPLYVGSPHTDLDVGTLTIKGKNKAGTDVSIVVPAGDPGGTDMIGRKHDKWYQGVNPVADDFLQPNSAYTVEFGGAGNIPATTFTNNLFLANTFTVSGPDLEDNGPLVAGTDYTVHWTPATSSNLPDGDEVLGLIWLADQSGSPTHVCVTQHSAGSFTIPGATINEFKQVAQGRQQPTNSALLLRQAVVHKLARLPNGETDNQRRIDMLGIMCWVQRMDVQ